MANWTVNNVSSAQAENDTVDATDIPQYVDLTITPNTGYVISATDFKIGGATESPTNTWTGGNVDSEVYKVVFSDIGTAGAVSNTVQARVWFADPSGGTTVGPGGSAWSMPGEDLDIYIDIDEKETVASIDRYVCIRSHHFARTDGNGNNKHTVTYAAAPTGITTTNNTPLIHNIGDGAVEHHHEGTVTQGQSSQIFEVTFATNTTYGYYYNNPPVVTFVTGQYSSYYQVVDSNLTYTSMTSGGVTSNKLTSITYTVYYTPPVGVVGLDPDPASSSGAMCELGQVIEFDDLIRQEDQGEPGTKKYVTYVNVNQTTIYTVGETRDIMVAGDNGAVFKLVVTRTGDGHTYDFTTSTFTAGATTSTETTIGIGGIQIFPVIFPSVSSNTTYDIIIVPTSPTSTLSAVPIVAGDLRLYQYNSIVVSLGISDPDDVWGEGTASGDIFHSSENTQVTLTGQAERGVAMSRAFSYTIKPAMLDTPGSKTIAPKSTLDFTLDNQGSVTTLTDGAPSSATFDVDSTTDIVADNTISWSVDKLPSFGSESTNEIIVGAYDPDASDQIPDVNIDDLIVGMVLSARNISSARVTIASIGSSTVKLSESISTNVSIPITFTATGVTVSSVTDANTLVASQSLSGLTDNLSLTFGGQESDSDVNITSGTVTQATDVAANVIIAGTLNVNNFGTTDTAVKIDIKELITITTP
jgi:hypothetical protein